MTLPEDAQNPLAPPLAPPLVAPESADAAPAAPPRETWWRRNRLALGAVAVLFPLAVGVIGSYEWWGYFSGRPVIAIDPDEKGVVTHADAVWGPVKSKAFATDEGFDVPPGSSLILVQIPVDVQGEKTNCEPPELVEQRTGRRWTQVRDEIGLPPDSKEPTDCLADQSKPFDIFVPFVVPDDAEGPYWVEIDTLTSPEFIRFTIDP
ncbi:hypothetical protein ACFU0W_13740 [Microbacterium keratanolyticum]|uniref:hypothetical protein n=1 Tax=Microbacterium keratanolyticum TaxID=67574 RepID=UPI00363B5BDA